MRSRCTERERWQQGSGGRGRVSEAYNLRSSLTEGRRPTPEPGSLHSALQSEVERIVALSSPEVLVSAPWDPPVDRVGRGGWKGGRGREGKATRVRIPYSFANSMCEGQTYFPLQKSKGLVRPSGELIDHGAANVAAGDVLARDADAPAGALLMPFAHRPEPHGTDGRPVARVVAGKKSCYRRYGSGGGGRALVMGATGAGAAGSGGMVIGRSGMTSSPKV